METAKKYKYLLFDNDGTLMDFSKAEKHAFEKTYKISGADKIHPYDKNVLKLYSDINDSWWKKLERKECTKPELQIGRFHDFLIALGIENIDPLFFSDNYPKYLAEGHFLFDGAKELLMKLSEKYKIYIITNGIGFVQKKRISESDYFPYIKGIFISEEIGAVKPDKEYFNKVLESIGAKKEECLIIGDSLSADIKGGNISGIDTLWYNPDKKALDQDIEITKNCFSYEDISIFLI